MNTRSDKGWPPKISGVAGMLGPIIFIGTFLLDGLLTPGYSLVDRPISDLALTGKFGWIQDVNFAVLGILLILFAVGFPRLMEKLGQRRSGFASAILLGISGAAYVLVAIFPAQAVGESPFVLHAVMHSIGFTMIFLSYGLALLLAGVAFKRNGRGWNKFAWYSVATAIFPIIAALGNLSSVGAVASGFETVHGAGLVTEILVIIALSWYIVLGYTMLKENGKETMNVTPNNGRRVLALLAILGVGYFELVIVALSLIDTEFSPISEAASLYGVGRYAVEMNLGFLVGGIGMISYALAVHGERTGKRSVLGAVLLFIGGLVLIMNSYFTTNVPGQPTTLHGTIHGLGGFLFFTLVPAGILLIARKFGRLQLSITLVILLIGGGLLLANTNAAGLAERIILSLIFATVIFRSLVFLRPQLPQK